MWKFWWNSQQIFFFIFSGLCEKLPALSPLQSGLHHHAGGLSSFLSSFQIHHIIISILNCSSPLSSILITKRVLFFNLSFVSPVGSHWNKCLQHGLQVNNFYQMKLNVCWFHLQVPPLSVTSICNCSLEFWLQACLRVIVVEWLLLNIRSQETCLLLALIAKNRSWVHVFLLMIVLRLTISNKRINHVEHVGDPVHETKTQK